MVEVRAFTIVIHKKTEVTMRRTSDIVTPDGSSEPMSSVKLNVSSISTLFHATPDVSTVINDVLLNTHNVSLLWKTMDTVTDFEQSSNTLVERAYNTENSGQDSVYIKMVTSQPASNNTVVHITMVYHVTLLVGLICVCLLIAIGLWLSRFKKRHIYHVNEVCSL